jgi:hypothetical protein
MKSRNNRVWEVAVLVLLTGVIYKVHRCDGLRWHGIRTKFLGDWFRHSGYNKLITSTMWDASMLVLLMERIYDVCRWDNLRWHDTYIPSFMAIDSGIQEILRVLPQQFERLQCWYCWWERYDVRHWDGLRWRDIYTPGFIKIWYRRSSNIKVFSQKFETPQCWYYWWKGFMVYAVEMP